jgi:hypothetical protein
MIKTVLFFIMAVVDAAILTSIVSTQLVLADVKYFGLDVTMGDRVNATIHDLLGVGPALLMLIGLSFLVAFVIARYAHRHIGGNRALWFSAAGFLSMPSALLLLKMAMGGTLLASARTSLGMFLVACCCMAGGYGYAWVTERYGNAGEQHA